MVSPQLPCHLSLAQDPKGVVSLSAGLPSKTEPFRQGCTILTLSGHPPPSLPNTGLAQPSHPKPCIHQSTLVHSLLWIPPSRRTLNLAFNNIISIICGFGLLLIHITQFPYQCRHYRLYNQLVSLTASLKHSNVGVAMTTSLTSSPLHLYWTVFPRHLFPIPNTVVSLHT